MEAILGWVDQETSTTSSKWEALLHSNFDIPKPMLTWPDVSAQGNNAPFKFNIASMVSLARQRLSEAQDHLWLLQTDPS